MKAVDVIVVGQGIAGTLLSFELMEAGLSVMVVDAPGSKGASQVASGVINPVTGRRVVETWKINELLPIATDCYQRISERLRIKPVATALDILAIHASQQMQSAFNKRLQEGSGYIKQVTNQKDVESFFKTPEGLHRIQPALLIDLTTLLSAYRQYLNNKGMFLSATFDWKALQLPAGDRQQFLYQNNDIDISAGWVIAAEGVLGSQNPYFHQLPFRYNKGEALIIDIPGLSRSHIYKLGFSIVPWEGAQKDKNLFWVGSTYQWEFADDLPTEHFKQTVINFLDTELLTPYRIIHHMAAVRPASINRRPFAGPHALYPRLGIINGLGTKGCSLAPYLAGAWKDYIISNKPFDAALKPEPDRQ